MTTKRQIKNVQYDITELVQSAMAAAYSQPLDLESARQRLVYLGNRDPDDELVVRYARETAILCTLARATGAYGFENQVGKINFSSLEQAISGVNAYLSRRNQAHRARWTETHRRY